MSLHSVLDRATWVAKHPLAATAHTVGVLRGTAMAATERLVGVDTDQGGAPATPERVVPQPGAPAAEQRAPDEPHESFATEPSAVTRDSAHGGRGADAELDDWYGEVDPEPAAEGVVDALELGDDGTTVDQSAINAELSRSEIARRDAERDPE